MRFPIILVLYFVEIATLLQLGRVDLFPSNPAAQFVASLGVSIALLLGPLLLGTWIHRLAQDRVVSSFAKDWCAQNGSEFIRIERHKRHFALIHELRSQSERARFVCRFGWFPWQQPSVEWLP